MVKDRFESSRQILRHEPNWFRDDEHDEREAPPLSQFNIQINDIIRRHSNIIRDDSESIIRNIPNNNNNMPMYMQMRTSDDQKHERRARNLDDVLIELENYNNSRYNINRRSNEGVQERIERIRGRRDSRLISYDVENILNNMLEESKKVGVEHNTDYFVKQAKLLTGRNEYKVIDALSAFQEGKTEGLFGIGYLSMFLKQDNKLPLKELSLYELKLDIQLNHSQYGNHFKNKYFDTKFNFCLTYNGALIASLGFNVQKNRMFIEQIQGIKGYGEVLKPLKWERALLNYAIDWAKKHDVPNVAVTSVENNSWALLHGHLAKEQGKMLYDVTAKRSGFKERDVFGNYTMNLSIMRPLSKFESIPYAQAVGF
jgi:hypothetical protein